MNNTKKMLSLMIPIATAILTSLLSLGFGETCVIAMLAGVTCTWLLKVDDLKGLEIFAKCFALYCAIISWHTLIELIGTTLYILLAMISAPFLGPLIAVGLAQLVARYTRKGAVLALCIVITIHIWLLISSPYPVSQRINN